MKSPFWQLLLRWTVLALGVTIATRIVPGIRCDNGQTLLVVVLLLSFFNAILKPLLVLFTLPFILFTLGLGLVVINALLFLLVGKLVDGFHVESFWSAAGGAVVVSLTSFILNAFLRPKRQERPPGGPRPRGPGKGDDVIDI